jgi:hypothetical protein
MLTGQSIHNSFAERSSLLMWSSNWAMMTAYIDKPLSFEVDDIEHCVSPCSHPFIHGNEHEPFVSDDLAEIRAVVRPYGCWSIGVATLEEVQGLLLSCYRNF